MEPPLRVERQVIAAGGLIVGLAVKWAIVEVGLASV